jgi:predicted phage-related endonuclease
MQATLDGFVVGRNEIVEAKKVMYFSYLKDKSAWGEQWTDQIPRHHIVQVQHQWAVLTAQTGEPWNTAWVAVCIGDDDWRMYQVQRLAELGEHIEQAVGRFWNEHVLPRVPPTDSLPSADILARIPRAKDSIMLHLDPKLVRPYLDARSRKEQAEADMDEAKARIVTAMGPQHDEARTDGGTTVTYRQAKRATFDKKGLIAAHPQIAASFTGTGSSPRFCVTPGADLLT